MTLVSTVTVGAGGAATVAFTGIPATSTDILVQVSSRSSGTGAARTLWLTMNSITTNYSNMYLYGTGSAAASSSSTAQSQWIVFLALNAAGATASTFSNTSIYLPNYAGSTAKSISVDSGTENNATEAYQLLFAGSQSSTAAITSLTLQPSSGTFDQNTVVSLYGILKGSGGATVT
jgi:hypothetical protein